MSETESAHDTPQPAAPIDLDGIERDLASVETALQRLDAGTYWTDEITGELLPDELLAVDPTARRAATA
ncbi:MAG: hypothetical protein WD023_10785 [Ilumatobacteraceae bacterium]